LEVFLADVTTVVAIEADRKRLGVGDGSEGGVGGGRRGVMTLDEVLVFGFVFLVFDVSVFGFLVLGLWFRSFRLLGLDLCLLPRYVCFYVCSVSDCFSSLPVRLDRLSKRLS
jgi:hypothetical protein